MNIKFTFFVIMIFGIMITSCKEKEEKIKVEEVKVDLINDEFPEAKTAVENALRDYIEGWYKGDTIRMDRSLHDDLVKRISVKDSSDIDIKLIKIPKSRMVELTGKGGGENPDAEYQIFVDDIEKDIATARLLSPEYLDYVHLVKTNEGWQIANILFRVR